MNVNKNDELILSALLSSQSVKQASEKCGITERTIYNHLENPDFKKRYDDERRKMFERSAAALQTHLDEAIETMAAIAGDPDVSPQIRLNASDAVIRNTLKLTERVDILDRLDALERLIR